MFLQCWLNGIPQAFTPGQYVAHSTLLARDLALKVPALVRVLPWEAFYYPGWSKAAMAWLFDPALKTDAVTRERVLAATIGIHLFASHANFRRWAGSLTEAEVLRRRCNLTELLAPHL
jgi:hypothetical protein